MTDTAQKAEPTKQGSACSHLPPTQGRELGAHLSSHWLCR